MQTPRRVKLFPINSQTVVRPCCRFCLFEDKYTTNACESFHCRYNNSFNRHHPNLYKSIDVLKDFQIDTYIKIRSAQTGVVKARKKPILKKYAKLKEYYSEYEKSGKAGRYHFVKKISYFNATNKAKCK